MTIENDQSGRPPATGWRPGKRAAFERIATGFISELKHNHIR